MSHQANETCSGLQAPVRNRFFYGKLLDVYHLDLEQRYFNQKRWLLNRMVSGYGVVCGLDVVPAPDQNAVIVQPGLAVDKWGREIIVTEPSWPVAIPSAPTAQSQESNPASKKQPETCDDDGVWNQLVLCYHECPTDPAPALGDDCCQSQRCSPGATRERYELALKPSKAPEIHLQCAIPDLVDRDRIDYGVLVRHISQPCRFSSQPCITLANIRLPGEGVSLSERDVDITVRPIVYSNDLLFEIIVGILRDDEGAPRGGKP